MARETPDSDNDLTCAELKADEGWKRSVHSSRPASIASEPEKRWTDIVTGNSIAECVRPTMSAHCNRYRSAVPLMMAYVTRYIYGTDKLRTNAFEVRGLNGVSSGIIHCDDLAILSQWLKLITDNIVGLTQLQVCAAAEATSPLMPYYSLLLPFPQMKLYNRNFAVGERIEYMGWVNEGVINSNISWQTYKPRFLALKGTEVMLFDSPPVCPHPPHSFRHRS